MGSLFCDADRQEGFKTIAGLARSRTMRPPVNAYDTIGALRGVYIPRQGCGSSILYGTLGAALVLPEIASTFAPVR
jgi:hypothetical protein